MNKLMNVLQYMHSVKFNALDSITIIVVLLMLELVFMTRVQ